MTSADDRPVWYASYGSNCSRDRFLAYLRGGRAEGAGRDQIGARDTRDPSGDEPVRFETAVCFVGRSTRWGGAPAFLEHDRSARPGALGRRYRVTRQQFADVLAQESGRPLDSVPLPDLDELEPGTRAVIGDGFYDALVILAPIDGVPCLSFMVTCCLSSAILDCCIPLRSSACTAWTLHVCLRMQQLFLTRRSYARVRRSARASGGCAVGQRPLPKVSGPIACASFVTCRQIAHGAPPPTPDLAQPTPERERGVTLERCHAYQDLSVKEP